MVSAVLITGDNLAGFEARVVEAHGNGLRSLPSAAVVDDIGPDRAAIARLGDPRLHRADPRPRPTGEGRTTHSLPPVRRGHEPGGREVAGEGLPRLALDRAGDRAGLLEERRGVLAGLADPRAGEDVVELVEEDIDPRLAQERIDLSPRDRSQRLGLDTVVLPKAISLLDQGLGGVAAGELVVELVIQHRQVRKIGGRDFLVPRLGGAKNNRRVDRPGRGFEEVVHLHTRRAAAVVANPVDIEPVHQLCLAPELHGGQGDILPDIDIGVVPSRLLVHEDAAPIGAFPPEELGAWELAGHRMVKAPSQAAGVVELHATLRQDTGDRVGMAEGIGLPVERQVSRAKAKLLLRVAPGVEQVPGQRLPTGEVLIPLDPVRRRHLPAPFLHPLADLGKERGMVLLHQGIDRRLTLGVGQGRVLLHELEHGSKGIVGRGDRLLPRPHPVHVDMPMAHTVDGVALGRGAKRGKKCFCLLKRERGGLLHQSEPVGAPLLLCKGTGKVELTAKTARCLRVHAPLLRRRGGIFLFCEEGACHQRQHQEPQPHRAKGHRVARTPRQPANSRRPRRLP